MKKLSITLVITLFTVTLHAQWFLGGSFGMNATVAGKPLNLPSYIQYDREYLVGFEVAPKMGYYFNEKLAFGLELALGLNFFNIIQDIGDPSDPTYTPVKLEGTSISWRVAPFLRYALFSRKKFSLLLEGTTGAGGQHYIYNSKNQVKYSNIGVGILNIAPVLSYSLTDRLQLETVLNFLNLGYNIDIKTIGEGNRKSTFVVHDLNIGFNAKSIFVISQLTIGVVYKFN